MTTGAGPAIVNDFGSGAYTTTGGAGGGTYNYGEDASNNVYSSSKGTSSLSTVYGNFSVVASGYASYVLSDASLQAGTHTLDLSGINSVTLNGASNTANTFTLSGYSGNATLNGLGSNNIFSFTPASSVSGVSYLLSNSSLQVSVGGVVTQTIDLNDIQTADLTGAASGANSFDISAWTGNGTLTGQDSTNTVVATNDVANFTLSDTLLQRTGHGDMTLSGIQTANLTGGSSVNTFTVSNWSGVANLDGKGSGDNYDITLTGTGPGTVNVTDTGTTGTDTVNVTTSATTQVTSSNVVVGTQTGKTQKVNYSGIELLNVIGGIGGLTYNVQSTSSAVTTTTVQTSGNSGM